MAQRSPLIVALFALLAVAHAGTPWDPSYYTRAKQIVDSLSLTEVLSLVHGYSGPYVGDVPAIPSANIAIQNLEDGPQGVADGVTDVTCWPSALTVTMSWDRRMMYEFGVGMGQEQYAKGTTVMLGPGVNIARVPWGGRNFEYLGEDPYLAGRLVYAEVLGIQSQNISGCVKHFVDNNQEYNRQTVSENVPRRAQWELYYPAFAAAVDAGVGSVMCSYNRINNTYACENPVTIGDLKGPLGFRGFLMSDWGATHSTAQAALAGLDQQEPDASFFGQPLVEAVAKGQVPESRVRDMAERIVVMQLATGITANQPTPDRNLHVNVTSDEHNRLARYLAEQSITLLKNDKALLPVHQEGLKTIAVIGDNETVHGGGSGGVIPPYVVTPDQGIRNYAANNIQVTYNDGTDLASAKALAAASDLVIVNVATTSHEGADRVNLSLPWWHDALVEGVAAVAADKTVVVARCPGPCLMPWIDQVSAVLFQLMPGQEAGNALASTIFGFNNPSGKLPVSFPNSMTDTWLSSPPGGPINPAQYPGTQRSNSWLEADYSEELLVGYRWYDSQGSNPLFPFGHGLSYTTFDYSAPTVDGSVSPTSNATISVDIANTGKTFGAEVAQLYLAFPASAGEPPKVLKGFEKVDLRTGEKATVTFHLSAEDVSIFDVTIDNWAIVPGTFTALVGSSSRDIRGKVDFQVSK